MKNRSDVLAYIDEALDQLGCQYDEASMELLRQRLNELLKPFDSLYDPPWVAFHSISVDQRGALTAAVEPLQIQQDIWEWCRGIEAYLGGRLTIKPHNEVDVQSLTAMRGPGA